MKKYIMLLLFGIVAMSSNAQPPNNAIFFGGVGEGSNATAFSIAATAIFIGSAGDGAAQASNNSVSNLLFAGGAGDGMNAISNNVAANIIYLGSGGDGFSTQSNNAISNNIFLGSEGDGFSANKNTAVPNAIYKGGEGDGWHAVVFPMGPLPVKLLSFTAEYAGAGHLVKWVTTSEINTSHFEIQRSANGRDFTTLGNVSATGGSSTAASYSFPVAQVLAGNNFYRLKMVDNDGSIEYSNMVLLKNMAGLKLTIFPNPTAQILYVRIPAISNMATIAATVSDANGKIVLQTVLKTGTDNKLDLNKLSAGLYSLQCIIDNKPFVLRFVKNQ